METRNSLNSSIGGIPSKDLSRYFPGVHLDLFKFLFKAEPTIQLTRIPIISNLSNIQAEPDLKLESPPASPEKSHSPTIAPSSNILIEEIDLQEVEVKPEPANTIGEQNQTESNEEYNKKIDLAVKQHLANPFQIEWNDKKSRVCPHCYQDDFRNNSLLKNHILNAHKLPPSETHPFICDQCPKRFKISSQLVFHQLEHKYGPDFLNDYYNGCCTICKKQSFIPNPRKNDKSKYQYLRNHILAHEGLYKTAKCKVKGCGKSLRIRDLEAHEAFHKKEVKMEICTLCGQEFQLKSMLEKHMKGRHGPFKCKYKYCLRTFPNETSRLKHAQIHEDDFGTTHLCPHCGKIFTRNLYLRKHLRTHEEPEKVKCTHDGCGKFITKEYLKEHIDRMHLPEDQMKKYICEICGAIFKLDVSLYKHKNVKHLQKFACPIPGCGLLNQNKKGLERHLKSHKNKEEIQAKIKDSDGPKYPCEKCDKVYSQSQSLRYHERTFHAKTKLRCSFEGCGREFTLQRYLDDHKMTHSTERVKCKFCEKSYTIMEIKWHIIKSHKKERDCPFKCSFCGDTFVREKILQIHIEKSHPNGE